jgi:hypothetical protein
MHKRTTEAEYYSKVLPSVTVRRCVIDARNRFANIHQQASKKFSAAAAAARVLCPSTFFCLHFIALFLQLCTAIKK